MRSLHKRLGGSFSTLLNYLRHHKEELELAGKVDGDLSDHLRHAIKAEIARAIDNTQHKFETQLTDERILSKELQELLTEHGSTIEKIETEYAAYKHSAEQQQQKFDREISVAQALVAESRQREKQLQEALNTLREKLHAAEVKAAVADTHAHDLEKQNQRLEQELKVYK